VSSDRARRVETLFQGALDREPEARDAFLRASCADDEALRREVDSLLEHHAAAAGRFLAEPLVGTGARAGDVIGRYAIVRKLGEGGMGIVYEAAQESPRRTIALKVLKRGVASPAALRRFEFESRVLARLSHPAIAQIHDAGLHDGGEGAVPWFAMELVPASRQITEHVSRRGLSTRERLELFATVCDAVHHGHQKGVVHRDLKPTNVLVDDAGRPKVIDFGVARGTDADLALSTAMTEAGQILGTLQYMSPEQVGADPAAVDVRSDVYSLGLLLYELLAGRPPYDVRGVSLGEAARLVREAPAPPLSAVDRSLRGDVETVAAKALEKEPARRYQSAAELLADVRAILADLPIAARPPSVATLLRVFARRHKALVAGVSAALAVLAAALGVVSALAWKLDREAALRDEVNGYLESFLMAADPFPFGAPGRARRLGAGAFAIEAIDDALARLDARPLGDAVAEATFRYRLGVIYLWAGRYERAHECLSRAYEKRVDLLGADHPDAAECESALATCLSFRFDSFEAERLALDAVERLERRFGEADWRTQNALGTLMISRVYLDYSDDVVATARRTIALAESRPDSGVSPLLAKCFLAQDIATRQPWRLDEGLALATSAVDESDASGERSLNGGFAHVVLGLVLDALGRLDGAEAEARKGIEWWTALAGRELPEFTVLLGGIAIARGRVEEGLAVIDGARADVRSRVGDDHPAAAYLERTAARTLARRGLLEEAVRAYRSHAQMIERGRHEPLQEHAVAMCQMGVCLRRLGRLEEAESALDAAMGLARRFDDAAWSRHGFGSLGWFHVARGEVHDALARRREAGADFASAVEEADRRADALLANGLLWRFLELGREEEAEALAPRAIEFALSSRGAPIEWLADACFCRGTALARLGRLAEAEGALRNAIGVAEEMGGVSRDTTVDARTALAETLARRGHPGEAEGILESTLATGDLDATRRFVAECALASILADQGRLSEAEIPALAALERRRRPIDDDSFTEAALVSLGDVLEKLGRPEDAAKALEAAVESLVARRAPPALALVDARMRLAASLLRAGRAAEAEAPLLDARAALEADGRRPERLADVGRRLAEAYDALGRPEDAARCEASAGAAGER